MTTFTDGHIVADSIAAAAPAAGGISSTGRLQSSAATTNANIVKASAGRLYRARAYNASAAVRYLKIYNKASAPNVGTDAPLLVFPILPGAVLNTDWSNIGFYFPLGISFAITAGPLDNDATAIAAADLNSIAFDFA